MVNSPTRSSLCTCAGTTDRTTGLTDIVTSLVLPTVRVRPTLHIDTSHKRITLETHSTHTSGLVEVHHTLGATATRSLCAQARVETVLLDAGLVHRAVVVNPTFWPVALSVGISSVALRTVADRMMHPGCALS